MKDDEHPEVGGKDCQKRASMGDVNVIFDGPSVFPEYLTDTNVMVCPSNNDNDGVLIGGSWNYYEDVQQGKNPCRFSDQSYNYFGWVLLARIICKDTAQENDAGITVDTCQDYLNPDFLTGVALLLGNGYYEWAEHDNLTILDGDITQGDMIAYRLREGVERFMIQDITDAAATTRAQSEIWVITDDLNSKVGNFNHVPGGANVLYMDGHVEFIKYPGKTPVSRLWSVFLESQLPE